MSYAYTICDHLPPISKGDRLELLFYCISCALFAGRSPLNGYLKNVMSPSDYRGYCGGDPGWEIDGCEDDGSALFDESGQRVFRCWALASTSDIEPETAYYTVKEVRHYVRIALDNIIAQHPESAKEAREMIQRYGLDEEN